MNIMNDRNLIRHIACIGALCLFGACAPTTEVLIPEPPGAGPPPALPERAVEFPPFHESVLPNGLRLIVVEHGAQPVVNLSLYIESGAAAEPAEQAGLAGMVADLLTQGTPTRTAQEIAETIEGVGGRMNASAGNDWMTVSSTVLTEHMPLAFDLLSEVVLGPTFPENELAIARRRTLSGLQAALGQPGTIAQRRFMEEIYGVHPYGTAPIPGTVQGLTRDDLVAFHRTHFSPRNALLVVSGAVNVAEVEAAARTHFGGWEGPTVAPRALPDVPQREQTTIYLVHRPGSVQSNIWIGHAGIGPDHPDFFALQVMNKILGQGADARLFQILREEKGWTYGAYSRLTRPRDIGIFAANAEVRTEVTDSAVVEMLHQLRRLSDEAIPSAEFEAAVSFLAGSFPLRIETAGQVASQVAQVRLLGQPVDELVRYRERIRAVTPADVRRVARDHVRPDRAAIVVVGDAVQILDGLSGIAPIELYDVEGRPLDRAALEVRAAEERFDAGRLQERTVVYELMVQGSALGTVTDRLARDGGDWVATSSLTSPFMSQESEVRFSAADFAPRSSTMRMTQGPMSMNVDVEVVDGRLTGRAEMPEQLGGDRDIDIEMVDGLLLPGMDVHLIAAADLAEGRTITVPVLDATTGNVANVTYEVVGTESVTVAAGTFNAFRVRIDGPQPMVLYVRQESPHLMVRQDFVGQPVSIELQSVE
jgi:zinc protease